MQNDIITDVKMMKNQFTYTFINDKWNMGCGESKSGLGSSLLYSYNYRNNLVRIIEEYKIEKIFDCSCGDWNWMKEISNHFIDYIGNDIVKELIEQNNKIFKTSNIRFVCNDMLSQLKSYKNEQFDLILCRHTLEHLSLQYCVDSVKEMKRVSKYLLITSTRAVNNFNTELNVDGVKSRTISLEKSPFVELLETPIEIFQDIKNINPDIVNGCCGFLYGN